MPVCQQGKILEIPQKPYTLTFIPFSAHKLTKKQLNKIWFNLAPDEALGGLYYSNLTEFEKQR